jgi:cell wall-associated NlpC family hydrolase
MTVSSSRISRPATRVLVGLTLVLGLFGGEATTGVAPAQAAVSAAAAGKMDRLALHYAETKQGAPYQYGAAGPTRFDCSGLVEWSFAQAGKAVPRTVAQQYKAATRVKGQVLPGDLVFFMSGATAYHVGIYVGAGRVLHSPHTGDHVRLATIWTSDVTFGRVG